MVIYMCVRVCMYVCVNLTLLPDSQLYKLVVPTAYLLKSCRKLQDNSLPSLPRTAARRKLLKADGSNGDKVIIGYLNLLLSLR